MKRKYKKRLKIIFESSYDKASQEEKKEMDMRLRYVYDRIFRMAFEQMTRKQKGHE